jgi:hypothetical protein
MEHKKIQRLSDSGGGGLGNWTVSWVLGSVRLPTLHLGNGLGDHARHEDTDTWGLAIRTALTLLSRLRTLKDTEKDTTSDSRRQRGLGSGLTCQLRLTDHTPRFTHNGTQACHRRGNPR